jgi:hypothetical protein
MSKPTPPVAPRIEKRIEQLGRTRTDDYAWMKDDNWQEVLRDPKLIKRRHQGAPDRRERLHQGHAGGDRRPAGGSCSPR